MKAQIVEKSGFFTIKFSDISGSDAGLVEKLRTFLAQTQGSLGYNGVRSGARRKKSCSIEIFRGHFNTTTPRCSHELDPDEW